MRGIVAVLTTCLHGFGRCRQTGTFASMFTPAEAANSSPVDALHTVILESVRIGVGNWRFYFFGAQLTVWGELSVTRNGQTFTRASSNFFSQFFELWGYELSYAEISGPVVTLYFGDDTIMIVSSYDGELASLLLADHTLADIWSWSAGTLSLESGRREPFDGLTP